MSNKPITARIKRTTKGGMVTQPLLNMGSPVKMKMSSPAKQGGRSREGNKMVSGKKLSSQTSASDKKKLQDRERAENKIRKAHIDKYKNNPNVISCNLVFVMRVCVVKIDILIIISNNKHS